RSPVARMNSAKSASDTAKPSVGKSSASAAVATARSSPRPSSAAAASSLESVAARARVIVPRRSIERAFHAFDEIVHLLEHDGALPLLLPFGDHHLALIVLQRSLEDDELARGQLCLRLLGLRLRFLGHGRAVGRHLDEALLEAAAHEVLPTLLVPDSIDVVLVHDGPVPLGAGEV